MMSGICKFLNYTEADEPELSKRLGLTEEQILIEDNYTCGNKKRKGDVCPQVVQNIGNTGFGLADSEEMKQCPEHPDYKLTVIPISD